MRNFKMINMAVAVVALAIGTGCGSGDDDNAGAGGKQVSVTLIALTTKNAFYQSLECGAAEKAKELGVDLKIVEPKEPTPQDQLPVLRAAIASKPDAIVIGPTDRKALTPTLTQAARQGIDVVDVDQVLEDLTDVTSVVATDQLKVGMEAAKWMREQMGDSGKAVVLSGPPGIPALDARVAGFEKGMEGSGIELKEPLRDKTFSPSRNAALVRAATTADPELTGFYTTYGTAATGVVSVARSEGKAKDWTIVSTDTEAPSMVQLKAGELDAIMGQKPSFVGGEGVQQAFNAATGKAVQKRVSAPITVITKDNIDEAEVYKTKAECK